MNQGLGVCTTDINQINVGKAPTEAILIRRENTGNMPIIGRKNFAMSICEGIINVTGGLNQFGHILTDFWVYNLQESKWKELKAREISSKSNFKNKLDNTNYKGPNDQQQIETYKQSENQTQDKAEFGIVLKNI